jgi:hypothetical protein
MNLEHLRLGVAAVWIFAALVLTTDLDMSWTTGAVMIALGLVPPIALVVLWDRPLPTIGRRTVDPRL